MALSAVGASDGWVGALGASLAGGALVLVGKVGEGAYSTFGGDVVTAEGLVVAKVLALATLGHARGFNVGVEPTKPVEHR